MMVMSYITLMRTIVTLSEPQAERLDRLAAEAGISRAEAIRRAVDRLLLEADQAEPGTAAFGLWASHRIDALKYEDRVRGEWSVRERRPGHQHRR
jgi:hypothetical protein